jgi:hypothetical protein
MSAIDRFFECDDEWDGRGLSEKYYERREPAAAELAALRAELFAAQQALLHEGIVEGELRAELDAANKAVDEARVVIEPFAREADTWTSDTAKVGNCVVPLIKCETDTELGEAIFTVGDLRAAKSWLTAHPRKEQEDV